MKEVFQKIYDFSFWRIQELIALKVDRYKWSQTYINWLKEEIQEAEKEIQSGKKVYLEDELWDVLWTYLCLLHSLESEWKIESHKVFERCDKKFTERIQGWRKWIPWEEVKKRQKSGLKSEQDDLEK